MSRESEGSWDPILLGIASDPNAVVIRGDGAKPAAGSLDPRVGRMHPTDRWITNSLM